MAQSDFFYTENYCFLSKISILAPQISVSQEEMNEISSHSVPAIRRSYLEYEDAIL